MPRKKQYIPRRNGDEEFEEGTGYEEWSTDDREQDELGMLFQKRERMHKKATDFLKEKTRRVGGGQVRMGFIWVVLAASLAALVFVYVARAAEGVVVLPQSQYVMVTEGCEGGVCERFEWERREGGIAWQVMPGESSELTDFAGERLQARRYRVRAWRYGIDCDDTGCHEVTTRKVYGPWSEESDWIVAAEVPGACQKPRLR